MSDLDEAREAVLWLVAKYKREEFRRDLAAFEAAAKREGGREAAALMDSLGATFESEDHTPDLPFVEIDAGDAIRALAEEGTP